MTTASDLSTAWLTCTSAITQNAHINSPTSIQSLHTLLQAGMGNLLSLWTVRLFETRTTQLCNHLTETVIQTPTPHAFSQTVTEVHSHFHDMRTFLQQLATHLGSNARALVRRFLLNSRTTFERALTPQLSNVLYRALTNSAQSTLPMAKRDVSDWMSRAEDSRNLCTKLTDLGLVKLVDDTVTRIVFETIDELVKERTLQYVNDRAIPILAEKVDYVLVPWIGAVLPHPTSSLSLQSEQDVQGDMEVDAGSVREEQLRQWRKRLSFHLHNSIGIIRVSQVLDLVHRYPISMLALEDLKICLRSTDLKPEVTASLQKQFTEKMLNAGIVTSEILKQYVNLIRALRYLDPSDAILHSVSGCIHQYLRRRPDTIRCIVSDMTGQGELYKELERGHVVLSAEDYEVDELEDLQRFGNRSWDQCEDELLSIDGDLDSNLRIDYDAHNRWKPEPIDAPTRDGKWKSGGDAITTLVAIYGSSEQIVNEYKGLLADKLSTQLEVDIERECRVLQLLTERFGREAMHDCDIMLKDFVDSTEVESELPQSVRNQLESFDTTVISKEFWPKLVEEPEFALMPDIKKKVDLYEESYEKLKDPRTLKWEQSLGAISVKLNFDDGREVEMTVTPVQATVLYHFANQSRLSVKELQKLLATDDESFVRRKLQSLVNLGLIRAVEGSKNVYETVERGGEVDTVAADAVDEGPDSASAEGTDGNDEAEMAVYQTYIMNMLQNLKQLPLEKIHKTLQLFVQTPVYDKTQSQLAEFLSKLVAEGKIELSAGMYRVKSKPKT